MLAWAPAFVALAAGASEAGAIEIDAKDGLITETIASKDRLREYDNIKKYGAESVLERDQSYDKPDPIRLGNFLLFSTLKADAYWNDNIFRSADNEVADWKSVLRPMIAVQSQLPRHALEFAIDGKLVSYLENEDQDYANVKGMARGAIHIDHAHTFSAAVEGAIEHEEPGEPTSPSAAAEPGESQRQKASVGITRDVGRLFGTLSTTFERWTFSDVEAVDGTSIDQSARDQDVISAQLRTGYRISPGYDVFGTLRTYRLENIEPGFTGLDSNGYQASVGVAFETNPLLRWKLIAGYELRDYDDTGVDNLGGYLLEANVEWLPTQRLTLTGMAKHMLSETAAADGLGTPVESVVGLRADYEIRHDLFAHATAEYRQTDFDLGGRIDDTYTLSGGLDYSLTKNWLFTIGAEHLVRDSTAPDAEMTRNLIRIGAKLKF